MSQPEDLTHVFIPPLVVLLSEAEKNKGSRLTQQEVEDIRDSAVCMTVRRSVALGMAERRGFDDIDPEQVWEQWQKVR